MGMREDRRTEGDALKVPVRAAVFVCVLAAAVAALPFARHGWRLRELKRADAYVAPPRHPVADADAFAPYAGSESCRECHREAYDQWRASHHGLAERAPDPARDEAAFAPARRFAHATQESAVGGGGGAYSIAAVGLSRQVETAAVVRVIGHEPLRQFLVAAPGGRLQTHEASYDPQHDAWFNVYGTEDRQPGEWGHWTGRGMNWNSMCASCHNTRVRKNYDGVSDAYRTTMAERSVGCEACHGPLKAHVEWSRAHPNTRQTDPTLPVMTPTRYLDTCASCHARRMELTGDFVPGDRFDDHYLLTLVDDSDLYYPDGQVRDENYEYAALLGSRMQHAGIRCGDCHQPHSAKTLLPGNLLCMRCHTAGGYTNAPVIDPVAHGLHKVDARYGFANAEQALAQARQAKALGAASRTKSLPVEREAVPSAGNSNALPAAIPDVAALAARGREAVWADGGECVNCHMPQTIYMQRHRRHDHGQTIPDPLLTKEHGIPNACNRCHTDKSVDWALEWTTAWYGDKMDRPSRRRAQVIASARAGEATARDELLDLLASDPNPYWQAVAAGLLEPWGGEPRVAAALRAASAHSNALVRAQVARALSPEEPALIALLDDPVRAVRYAAAWARRGGLDPGSTAGRELQTVLDYVADQPLGQMQAGAYALAQGDLARAAAHYRKAVDWDPNSAPIRHDAAVVFSQLGQADQAVAQLEAACRLEPANGEFRYKLALAWNESGRADRAIANLQEAVRLDPLHARAWYNLGLALAGENQFPSAAEALGRAAALDPGPDAPYALATVYARAGNRPAALAAVNQALQRAPSHAEALHLRAALAP